MRLGSLSLFAILLQLTNCLSISGDIIEAIKRDVTSTQNSKSESVGYVRLSGTKSYADSISDLLANSNSNSTSKRVTTLSKSTNSNGEVEFTMKNQGVFYSVDVKIGSQGDVVTVLVDTGSSDFWVMGSDNTYCQSGTGGTSHSTLSGSSSSSSSSSSESSSSSSTSSGSDTGSSGSDSGSSGSDTGSSGSDSGSSSSGTDSSGSDTGSSAQT
ncbi:unnamed protein product [Ambrosiozyma monospora]|uniref:Unnamed protein product n=1 Tax=Ambrosiozyma monospora TaxID=43982 RepID=A0ACB5SVK2_AMBMO|nr:unnamed protein product [Ambrosiozyma monospora]